MKKLKKINLNLNKEIVSNLSNQNLNQVKGGSVVATVGVCPPQTVNAGTICPATDTISVATGICIYSENNCGNTDQSICYCAYTDNCESVKFCRVTYNC